MPDRHYLTAWQRLLEAWRVADAMTGKEFEGLLSETLRAESVSKEHLDRLAERGVQAYDSGDARFRDHVRNRSRQVSEKTGQNIYTADFDAEIARMLIADEIGFANWSELVEATRGAGRSRPLLFQYTIAAMERGDFSALETMLGGPQRFDEQVRDWYENGLFDTEPETLAEVLSAACMLGRTGTARYLLRKGVDPYAGMRSWLAGPHYAVSSGHLETVRMLLEENISLEVENLYGGTVLGQALWSAVNEHKRAHAEIIEILIAAGARVEPGTLEWWREQDVPSPDTKRRIADALTKGG